MRPSEFVLSMGVLAAVTGMFPPAGLAGRTKQKEVSPEWQSLRRGLDATLAEIVGSAPPAMKRRFVRELRKLVDSPDTPKSKTHSATLVGQLIREAVSQQPKLKKIVRKLPKFGAREEGTRIGPIGTMTSYTKNLETGKDAIIHKRVGFTRSGRSVMAQKTYIVSGYLLTTSQPGRQNHFHYLDNGFMYTLRRRATNLRTGWDPKFTGRYESLFLPFPVGTKEIERTFAQVLSAILEYKGPRNEKIQTLAATVLDAVAGLAEQGRILVDKEGRLVLSNGNAVAAWNEPGWAQLALIEKRPDPKEHHKKLAIVHPSSRPIPLPPYSNMKSLWQVLFEDEIPEIPARPAGTGGPRVEFTDGVLPVDSEVFEKSRTYRVEPGTIEYHVEDYTRPGQR